MSSLYIIIIHKSVFCVISAVDVSGICVIFAGVVSGICVTVAVNFIFDFLSTTVLFLCVTSNVFYLKDKINLQYSDTCLYRLSCNMHVLRI